MCYFRKEEEEREKESGKEGDRGNREGGSEKREEEKKEDISIYMVFYNYIVIFTSHISFLLLL